MLKANFQRVKRDVDRILPENFCKELPSKTDIYLVGGILRDSFFPELSPREIDLLIIGMEIDELLSVLRKFGKANLVGKSFGVIKWRPRKNSPDIDVSIPAIRNINLKEGIALNPYMSIEDDLAQRDFTANAIALNLQTDEVLDPLGGIEDIEKGFLKTISSESLKNDPHRIVRASYICARCNLKITTETLDLMSKSLPELKHITSERIAEELKKIMLYLEKPSKALRLWRDWEILDYILPELSESVGVTQEGGWHAYDVFEHSLAAVDAAPAKLDVRLAA